MCINKLVSSSRILRFFVYVFAAVATVAFAEAAESNADFYVSTEGSDSWTGTFSEANGAGDDGPFATLERARAAVRDYKKTKKGDIVVYIRGGTYRLDGTVVFGVMDSGEGDATITYAAYPGEIPLFTSSEEIGNWEPLVNPPEALPEIARGKVMVAEVPERFYTLYDGEGRLPRARSEGFAAQVPTGAVEQAAFKKTRNKLFYPDGVLKNWSNINDVELLIRPQHAWIYNILPLASVDEEAQVAYTKIPGSYTLRPQIIQLVESELCWVENVLEALDEPGEWVLNTEEGKLYLWPRSETSVFRPRLRELIRVEGKVDKGAPVDVPVRNLVFSGLGFSHGDRYTLKENDAGLQHDWEMLDVDNALFRIRGGEDCVIEQCRFSDSGGGAIRVDLHGQNIRIENNQIERIGGTGILLCGYGPGTKDVNHNNFVVNNRIRNYGEIYRHSPGVMLWQSGENCVANNLIHDAPYCGVIVSGFLYHFFGRPDARELVRTIRWQELDEMADLMTWNGALPYLHSHDNVIEFNEIHHVMREMADGNGIYVRGAGAGNIVRRNYIHHLLGPSRMQAAIRTDGGQRDTLIAENIIYKCTSKGIVLKLNNRVENNIVMDLVEARFRGESIPASYLVLRESPLKGATIQRNVFFSSADQAVYFDETKERRFPIMARAKDADTDFNLYYSKSERALVKAHLKKSQGEGIDVHSLSADPLFVDLSSGDFRLLPESPARDLGILSLDASEMGPK